MALIRKEKGYSSSLPSIHAYLDEISEVVSLLGAKYGEIKISTRDHDVEAVADLKGLGSGPIDSLSITPRASGVSVSFHGFSVSVSSSKIENHGVAMEVENILRRGRVRWLWFFRDGASFVFSGLVGLIAASFLFRQFVPSWLGLVGIFGISAYIWLSTSFLGRHGLVYPRFRADKQSFWARKGDDLIVNLVVLIVGAVIGAVITKMTTK